MRKQEAGARPEVEQPGEGLPMRRLSRALMGERASHGVCGETGSGQGSCRHRGSGAAGAG